MYLRKILLLIVVLGLILGGVFAYKVYDAIFSPNTKFENNEAFIYIPTNSTIEDVSELMEPLLKNPKTFLQIAERKGYSSNVKGGKYAIQKGMNNNDIVNSLRSNNIPVQVSFNNQETLADLAGRISSQIEPDSLTLLSVLSDKSFYTNNGFTEATQIAMFIPNSYEFFWNASAENFRDRMLREYNRFWNEERRARAELQGLTPNEVVSLAS
ncbi:MAG: endolytic transglycosylase MltG, partial [Maribacter sp.]|nr:endolytic transglycosylase MltG [Maribacter sp.]